MTCIAVTVADGCAADPALVATWCKAVDAQAAEFAQAWDCEYTPVLFFSGDVLEKLEGDELAAFVKDSRLLTIQDALDVPGALGYHDDIAGVIFARVEFQGDDTSVTLSHEVLEEMGDPTCEEYVDTTHSYEQALEACDRVEGDTYAVETDGVFVRLSNYLLPNAFKPNSARPWDRLGKLHAWDGMTPGGYMIRRNPDGSEAEVFAASAVGAATAEAKIARGGRAARRVGATDLPVERPVTTPAPRAKRKRA